jgi:hypothetical protein
MALIHSQTSSQTPAVKVFTGTIDTPILPSLLFVTVISINIKETKKSNTEQTNSHLPLVSILQTWALSWMEW